MRIARDSVDRFFDTHLHMETRTVYLGDEEDGVDRTTAKNMIKAFHLLMADSKEKPITLYINSEGGCWYNGMAVYDMIKNCPCHVTAYVVGMAMSMGSIILQAADTRIMYPNSTLMIHDGTIAVEGIPKSFQNWAEHFKINQQLMYKVYSERTGKPIAYWRRQCAADFVLNASQAKEMGLVDDIYQPQ